jgi:hypothetical protein
MLGWGSGTARCPSFPGLHSGAPLITTTTETLLYSQLRLTTLSHHCSHITSVGFQVLRKIHPFRTCHGTKLGKPSLLLLKGLTRHLS